MERHRDRNEARIPLLHTERSKGEMIDRQIKIILEAETMIFTQLINRMREMAIESGEEPLEIIKDTIEFSLTERDKFNPFTSIEGEAQWGGYNAAYLRMTMLDPSLDSPL
ncbi:MAG: hypothetical protein H9W81_13525 [Enterococcus sp.]|nr:hypothetical protein [Enterococcus sp.]